MKKTIIGSFLLMVLLSTPAFAGGTADIPLWKYFKTQKYNAFYTLFYVTNRGEEDVTVTLKLYHSDGSPAPRFTEEVTIPAHGVERIGPWEDIEPKETVGSGTISWEYINEPQERSKNIRKPLSVTISAERYGYKLDSSGWTNSISWHPLMVDGDIWF